MLSSLTLVVHFVELLIARRIDISLTPALHRVFELGADSLLLGVESVAWHFFFGLSLLFAASAFLGRGKETDLRGGLRAAGALCLHEGLVVI